MATKENGFLKFVEKNKLILAICLINICAILALITPVFSYITIGLSLVLISVLNYENGLIVTASMLPYSSVLKIFNAEGGYFVILAYYCLLSFIKLLVNKELRFDLKICIPAALFLVYCLLPIGPYEKFKWAYIGVYLLLFIGSMVFWRLRRKINVRKVLHLAILFMVFVYVITPVAKFLPLGKMLPYTQIGERYGALFSNCNYLGFFCAISGAMLVSESVVCHGKLKTFFYFLVTLAMGLSTLSKAFMLVALVEVAILGIYYLVLMHKRTSLRRYFWIVISVVIVVGCALVSGIIARFEAIKNINFDVILTGRVSIWHEAMEKWTTSAITIIFGNGLASPASSFENLAHNVYIEFLQKTGIIGLTLLLLTITFSILSVMKNRINDGKLILFFPLVLCFIYGLTSTLIVFDPALFCIFMAIAFLDLGDRNKLDLIKINLKSRNKAKKDLNVQENKLNLQENEDKSEENGLENEEKRIIG